MAGKAIPYATTLTASGGTISSNLSTFTSLINAGGFIYQIFLKSRASDTLFDFYVKSPSGNIIYHKKNITQLLNDNSMTLPVQGTYTFTIEKSSKEDETFDLELGFKEERV